jgi:hypothetical protein
VIRVAEGEIDGPLLFRNELMAVDGLDRQRAARDGEVKRLGEHPVVMTVCTW